VKTTIEIPDKELKQVMKFTGARTKRDAVVAAVADFNRRKRLEKLAGMLGTFEDFMTLDELKKMREES
jgi:hypothetical protein